jgi:transcriptional regulator with XRE-family HTH domain
MRAVFKAVTGAIGAVLGGLWLLALYGFTLWISAGSLSAIQLRADLANDVAPGGEVVSFSDVQRAEEKYNTQLNFIYSKTSEIYRRIDEANVVQNAYFKIDDNIRTIADALGVDGDFIDPLTFSNGPEFSAAASRCARPEPGDDAFGVCGLIDTHMDLLSDARLIDSTEAYGRYSAANEEARAQFAEIERQIEELRNSEPLSRHFDNYAFFRTIGGYEALLRMPQHVLVLILTLAMGMLGSVVTMTWLFIRQDTGLSARRFLILPFIGSMSAFIILIFISAGQLTLTAGDAQDSLNPFVLSFVGIISGLLSERAYTRISEVGSTFFAVDDGQPRWGYRLREALEAAGVSIPELARHLGTTEEEAGRIVSESTTATLTQQRLIAACVRRNVRELFTDVPPDGPAGNATDAPVVMPDLTGLDPAVLKKVAEDLGLRLGERAEAPSEEAAAGLVMAQSPSAGSRVPRRTRVSYTVAVAPPGSGAAEEPGGRI